MSHKEHIDIDYLARVEGETAVSIEVGGEKPVQLKIFEPPRFFEGFMVGRKFDEIGDIVSRICGICPVSHMTTAILAIEKAMNIQVSEQTSLIRKIMCISQIVASHLIHLYMLAMPDYYGRGSVLEMLPEFKDRIGRLMKMKEVMNDLTALIGGRALHPVTHMPGGFTSIPDKKYFDVISRRLEEIKRDAAGVVRDISFIEVPDFQPDTEYVCLDAENEYAVNTGRIISTSGLNVSQDEYENNFEESQVSYAMAKQSVIKNRGSFMVGALARMNLKRDKLQDETKALARDSGLDFPCGNPFKNNLAQALEVFDGIERCVRLIESCSFKSEGRNAVIKEGEGCAVTEAPRGLLYHRYGINRKGVVESAGIVTPTSHNFINIEKDLKKLSGENKDKPRDEIRLLCEKLVRAYDPCFSCSVH
jgi:sulfhydrogenase subunit alpha